MSRQLYIGLMSGTSMDGVDGVVIDLGADAHMRVIVHRHRPYDDALRAELLRLNQSGDNELHRCALAGNAVARAYAEVVAALLSASGLTPSAIRAIGAHGQTVRHRPLEFDGVGYTAQLLNPSLLAERTGIAVACDFRSRDLAAGGQGAPLVPAFHHAAFGRPDRDLAVLNLGGIANITLLPSDGAVSGHDCGPGNVLLDLWCERHTGHAFDADGAWGRSGQLCEPLLRAWMDDEFVQRRPPKSTGRDRFHAAWLDACLAASSPISPADVQCTLTHFTARAAMQSIQRDLPHCEQLLVCGGGALNRFLMECLQAERPKLSVLRVDDVTALDPMHVEAAAFAWLAQARIDGKPGNLPAVTGAKDWRVLGGVYAA